MPISKPTYTESRHNKSRSNSHIRSPLSELSLNTPGILTSTKQSKHMKREAHSIRNDIPYNDENELSFTAKPIKALKPSKKPEHVIEVNKLQVEVSHNKTDISSMKQKLEDLEYQIVQIGDKTDKYRDMTNEIIHGITERVQQAEDEYTK